MRQLGAMSQLGVMRQSGAMIGVARQNHRGAIKLFSQHRAKQHMWPGSAAKGNPLRRPVKNRAVMPVGAANGEVGHWNAIITLPLQKCCQRLGRGVTPVRITGNQRRRRRKVP